MLIEQTTDLEIRNALHKKVLRHSHACPKTIVIDELGLAHGKNRIDVAVLNGCLHGYEIKSSKDNLNRLPKQLETYNRSLQKLTIVAASNHIEDIMMLAPKWSGIVVVSKGPRGGMSFSTIRRSSLNPDVDITSLAHLLWKQEVIEYLAQLGLDGQHLKGSRKVLYRTLSRHVTVSELVEWIKVQFLRRESWRVGLQPLQDDDLRQLASM